MHEVIVSPYPICHHLKAHGGRCGSPALRNQRFCYYHKQVRNPRPILTVSHLDTAHGIQLAVQNILTLMLTKKLDPKTAGVALYGLQIAASNNGNMVTPAREDFSIDDPDEQKASQPQTDLIEMPTQAIDTVAVSTEETEVLEKTVAAEKVEDDVVAEQVEVAEIADVAAGAPLPPQADVGTMDSVGPENFIDHAVEFVAPDQTREEFEQEMQQAMSSDMSGDMSHESGSNEEFKQIIECITKAKTIMKDSEEGELIEDELEQEEAIAS